MKTDNQLNNIQYAIKNRREINTSGKNLSKKIKKGK